MKKSLIKSIEYYKENYNYHSGNSFSHFYCPIMLKDENVEMCCGHIINKELNKKIWVPQRKDIDNFYGSITESDMIIGVDTKDKDVYTIFDNPDWRKRYLPKLYYKNKLMDYYFTSQYNRIPNNHSVFKYGEEDNIIFKTPLQQMLPMDGKILDLKVQHDFRPAIVASLIKSAYLTLFYLFGYQYALSPSGKYIGWILKDFFERNKKTKRKNIQPNLAKYFSKHMNMLRIVSSSMFQGTINDDKLCYCIGTNDTNFAIGIFIKIKYEIFLVFLPTSEHFEIGLSFLKEPPKFIKIKPALLQPPIKYGPLLPRTLEINDTEMILHTTAVAAPLAAEPESF